MARSQAAAPDLLLAGEPRKGGVLEKLLQRDETVRLPAAGPSAPFSVDVGGDLPRPPVKLHTEQQLGLAKLLG